MWISERRAAVRRRVLALLAAALAGCAVPPPSADLARWSGRLSVRVDEQPVRLWNATFVLSGSPERGALSLHAPLGATVAQAQWGPGWAQVRTAEGERRFDDVDALTQELLGEPLPLDALFGWLSLGRAATPPGWAVDESRRDRGILVAQRDGQDARPAVRLTVALDAQR